MSTRTKAAPAVEVTDQGYVSVTDTAKLVRWHLARAYPGVKFSVTSSRGLGADVCVAWIDGPTQDEVRESVRPYNGQGFDGMTDATTFSESWLMPDGTARRAVSGIGSSWGTGVTTADGDRLPPEQHHDYIAGLRTAAYGQTTRYGYDRDSAAFQLGLADVAAMTEAGARLVTFGGGISTHRRLSPELTAELEGYVLFLAREHDGGPFDGNRRYDLAVPLTGDWEGYGSQLVHRLSWLSAAELDKVLEGEAARRARNAAVRFSNDRRGFDARVDGYYVTVRDGQQWGALLGPFASREEAQAQVPEGKRLAEARNDRAIWYAYGTAKVTSKPGRQLEAGILEKLPERQLALAGLAA